MALSGTAASAATTAQTAAVDLSWYPPRNTSINDLAAVLDDSNGIYGFVFNSSDTPPGVPYGTYNWCNMPHVRKAEYVKPSAEYELQYVEVIQRHHKRTPYASNSFPVEPYRWDCPGQGLFHYGQTVSGPGPGASAEQQQQHQHQHQHQQAARGYWQGYTSPVNPYTPSGWTGTCQFPQITLGGLDDAHTHGRDLYEVYHELLGFLPSRDDADEWRARVAYRVTQNVITSQVAGMLISGTWATSSSSSSLSAAVPLLVQAASIDSLEPQYACAAGDALSAAISAAPTWRAHLDATRGLFHELDAISGVPDDDAGFHVSFDHYYDNLSARQCHAKPLPCRVGTGSGTCVDQRLADAVYRAGQWEYSWVYRDAPASLAASVAAYGVWIAELSAHLRGRVAGEEGPIYFHNVAHDGSVSRVLSILQVDVMVWPGMGSEIVFELYRKTADAEPEIERADHANARTGPSGSDYYVRVLFSGQVLQSSHPSLGVMDMVPLGTLLAYFDGLVGENASLVVGKCNGTISI
ncbi:histidine acid phosphatase family protein [Biscogniauxia mediterranea]|nr:histidine acid phosphatase family protein [Biscogniauxia mediterranea]